MASTKKIIEEIQELSARDRRIVIKHLEQPRAKPSSGTRKRSVARRTRQERPYVALIKLAGIAHSDHTDVSTDKYRHLASSYSDNHEAK